MALVVALCLGCGGSGSSGFDAATEPEALRRAVSEDACVGFADTLVCAPGVPVSLDGGAVASVTFDVPSGGLACAIGADGGCEATVTVVPDGIADDVPLLGAAAATEDGPWTLTAIEAADPIGPPGARAVTVTLPATATGGPITAVVAVLVFETAAPAPGATTLRLTALGPSVIFASGRLDVRPVASPAAGLDS